MNWILDTTWFWGVCFLGICVAFSPELPKKKRALPVKKTAKRNAKGTKPKPRTAPKAKKQAAKPWYVAPPMTPEQERAYDRYRKYFGKKVDDSWGGYGIPL